MADYDDEEYDIGASSGVGSPAPFAHPARDAISTSSEAETDNGWQTKEDELASAVEKEAIIKFRRLALTLSVEY
jgi:hypothetical protein